MKNNLPSDFDAITPYRHFWFTIRIRTAGYIGHSRSGLPRFAFGRTFLLILLLRRVQQIAPLNGGNSCPSRGVILGGTIIIFPVRWRTLVVARRQTQSRSLFVSCWYYGRHFGRSTITVGITLRFRVVVIVTWGHRFLRFGWLFLARSGDRSRPAAGLAVLQILVRCPVTAFRTLDGFPGSSTFLSIGHFWLLRLSAIVFNQLILFLIRMMIAVTERTHMRPLQGLTELPIMRLFSVWSGLRRYFMRILPSGIIL